MIQLCTIHKQQNTGQVSTLCKSLYSNHAISSKKQSKITSDKKDCLQLKHMQWRLYHNLSHWEFIQVWSMTYHIRCMASGFYCKYCIKRVVRKWHFHEISLHRHKTWGVKGSNIDKSRCGGHKAIEVSNKLTSQHNRDSQLKLMTFAWDTIYPTFT